MIPNYVRAILLTMLLLASYSGFAQTEQKSNDIIISKSNELTAHKNPLMEFADFIFQSKMYENMMSSPDFVKVQDIARRLWDNQTGAKHKVRYSRRIVKFRQ